MTWRLKTTTQGHCIAILFTLLVLSYGIASSEELRFHALPQEMIEARMKRVPFGNKKRSRELQAIFGESGCAGDRLQIQAVKGVDLGNIICTLPGVSDSIIIVGAHFDHTLLGHGAVDNWSGTALLPSLFQAIVSDTPRKHTYIFIGFTEEERGLVGSEYYARNLTPEQRKKIQAMINLDSLGLSTPVVWLSQGDAKLAGMLKAVANALKIPLTAVNVDGVGTSDSISFSSRKIPSLTVHSVTQDTFSVLHSPHDTMAAIKMEDYYKTYRLLAAYLVYLDSKLE